MIWMQFIDAMDGGWMQEELCNRCTLYDSGNQVAVHVMALQDKMNQVQLRRWRLPKEKNECTNRCRLFGWKESEDWG